MMTIVRRNGPRGRFDGSAQLWDITAHADEVSDNHNRNGAKGSLDAPKRSGRILNRSDRFPLDRHKQPRRDRAQRPALKRRTDGVMSHFSADASVRSIV
jgi:hypothetical protein